jgi:Na+/melibiose symporter-like transporter
MASPSKLSSTWFPARQRTTVTAFAAVACEIGFAFAFYIPDMTDDLEMVLLQEQNMAIAVGILAAFLSCFHDRPNAATSISAVVQHAIEDKRAPDKSVMKEMREEIVAASGIAPFMVLSIFVGTSQGVWSGWCPMIPEAVMPNLSENQGDEMSLYANLATIVGGLLIGPIAERWWEGHYKTLLVILYTCATVCFTWFTIALPTPSPMFDDTKFVRDVRDSGFHMLNIPVILTGVFQGAMVPLVYELSAEICFPMSDGTSAGIYQLFVNLGQMLFLFVPVLCHSDWFNTACLFSMVFGLAGLFWVRPVYRRKKLRDLMALQSLTTTTVP